MHSKTGSILKRWHSLAASPQKCAAKWQGQYWQENEQNEKVISCRTCASFNASNNECGINFGSPLRKCVVSSIEAHLHDCKDQEVLELGFGRFMLARNLIQRSGGRWTGVEPQRPQNEKPSLGKGGYGSATDIPFAENTFDRVFGVQSMEHWGQIVGDSFSPSDYGECLAEINRVLKPGASIYLDAPIHFHGHEMFIMSDVIRIKALFENDNWCNVRIERWREDSEPLDAYRPPQSVLSQDWPIEISSYSDEAVSDAKENGVVWMIVVTADKTASVS